jgi:hypothetical protein
MDDSQHYGMMYKLKQIPKYNLCGYLTLFELFGTWYPNFGSTDAISTMGLLRKINDNEHFKD